MEKGDTPAQINTYHCICTTLILATPFEATRLPKRKQTADSAYILPLSVPDMRSSLSTVSVLHNVIPDRKSVVIKREDGFEKRLLLRCQRCELVVGYRLDEAHFGDTKVEADKIVYVLPGSLISTEDMMMDRAPPIPMWTQAV